MFIFNQVSALSFSTLNVGCKSTAKYAETSSLQAVQHYLNYVLLVGSSSAVTMISISHLMSKLIIIYQLILSLDICRGQLVLFDLDYTLNIEWYYSYLLNNDSSLLFQEISGFIYTFDIVKQDILQILSFIYITQPASRILDMLIFWHEHPYHLQHGTISLLYLFCVFVDYVIVGFIFISPPHYNIF